MVDAPPPLGEEPIIKKIKKGGHGGHHGGAWKIAYADFVTAMMAFFLLLWLLSSTTEEQKRGIADYYNFGSIENGQGGTFGIMDGAIIEAPAAKPDKSYDPVFADPTTMSFNLPPTVEDDSKTERTLQISKNENTKNGEEDTEKAKEKKRELIRKLQEQDEAKLKQTREKILKSLEKNEELSKLLSHLKVDVTPEGLLIQLTDKDKRNMFEVGSAKPMPEAIALLKNVAKVALTLPNLLIISGHTDGKPFERADGYGNWELSADRANASRRVLVEADIPITRIKAVKGLADREHLDKENPLASHNRRIAILLEHLDYEGIVNDPNAIHPVAEEVGLQ